MREFLKTYRSVFWVQILLYIVGNIFEPLAIVVLGGAYLVWMNKKKEGFLLLTLLIVLVMGDSRSYDFLYVKNLRIIAIILLAVYTTSLIGSRTIKFRPLLLGCIPFFFIAFMGGLRSPSVGLSMAKMLSYFLLIFVTLHLFPYLIRKTKGTILMDIVHLSAIFLILGLVGIVFYPGRVFLAARYRGMLGNPNGLGVYCSLIFPITLAMISLFPLAKRRLRLILLLVVISAILSGSRTTLGTIGIFYFLYVFYKRGSGLVFLLWAIVLPSIYILLTTVGIERLVQLVGLGDFLRVESLTTGTGRFLAWQMGLNEIARNPFIGRGFAYEEMFFHDLASFLVGTEHQGGMHNSYLTFILNNGYIGFLFFLVFLLILLSRVKAKGLGTPFIIAMLIAATFESWLNSSLNAFTIHFFLALTLFIEFPRIKAQLNTR